MEKKNYLIYKLTILFILAMIVILVSGRSRAMNWESVKPEYIGVSLNYGRETSTIKNSEYVDYSNEQRKLFAGKNIADSWRIEYDFIIANIREHDDSFKKDETLFGFQLGLQFDFFRINHFNFYTGISAGLGYLKNPNGYVELAPDNPFGLLDSNLGIGYKFNNNFFLRVQTGIWHISSLFSRDQGHNCWDSSIHLAYNF